MTAVLATPLRMERHAVRRAVRRASGSLRVVRTGMGAAATLSPASEPVLVAGVAGGLVAEVRPGDVVVADSLTDGGRRIGVPSAPLLAAALRRRGLTVHCGQIRTTDRIATGARRTELARTGALAVDLESFPLAAAARGPVAVVRSIVDTEGQRMWTPGTIGRGRLALRVLGEAVPAFEEWAAATGSREILLAGPRSFCAGVVRAIETVDRALARHGAPVYVRRQIVHNGHVVDELRARGAVFVAEVDEVPAGSVLVFAAHGVTPEVRRAAAERNLTVVDATCPLVAKVHAETRRYAGRGHTVFLIGHADHEEVEGTRGEAPDDVIVVADVEQARRVRPRDPDRVAYVMQTTLAVDEAERVAAVLRERFPAIAGPHRDDVCYATTNRQAALRAVARDADLVLVVGSTNSSNSQRLVEVARREGTPAHLVEDAYGIDLRWLAGARRIALTAGASAPPSLVDEIVRALSGLGPTTVHERAVLTEEVEFALPREVS